MPGASPVRLATRKMWVSTATVGWPKAVLSTTLAVLRPTPGSFSSASRSAGTSPPCSSSRICDSAITFFALVRNSPMVRMCASKPATPSATICAGVPATSNSRAVARLTDLSVACADSTTATSSWYGVR